jgi:hypothetical protein
VSKRHQSHRRKTYGRRQHDAAPGTFEAGMDDLSSASLADTLAFLDPRAARMIFALGD